MDTSNIIYFLLIFLFLKYGIKELNIIYLIIISFGILFFIKNYMKKNNTTISKKNEFDTLISGIEKYDNNNLLLKIKKNYKNLSKYLKKSNKTVRDMDNIDFLKNKVLDYINSLNVGHNDKIIDSVYNSVSKLIDSKSE